MFRVTIISLFVVLIYPFITGCGQPVTQASKTTKDTATCILFGPEAMTYYYGDSAKMEEKKEGSIYDHVFMSYVLTSIKKHSKTDGFKVIIKPVSSADVMANLSDVIDIFNTNDIQNRYVDKTALGITHQPLKLNLPALDSSSTPLKVGENDITLLLYSKSIYGYQGSDIKSGFMYNYANIDGYLKNKVKKLTAKGFAVIIKPSDDSSYKNVVDILDEMKINNIEKYSLIEITKDEVNYIKTLK